MPCMAMYKRVDRDRKCVNQFDCKHVLMSYWTGCTSQMMLLACYVFASVSYMLVHVLSCFRSLGHVLDLPVSLDLL